MDTLSKQTENDFANIIKPHSLMKKAKKYILKKPQMILRNYIQISQKKGKKKNLLGMQVFSSKI